MGSIGFGSGLNSWIGWSYASENELWIVELMKLWVEWLYKNLLLGKYGKLMECSFLIRELM